MTLTKKALPDYIVCEGRYISIHTEHYYWLGFHNLLSENESITLDDVRHLLINPDEPINDMQGLLDALLAFYNAPEMLPHDMGGSDGRRLLDYEIDASLIYAGFLECYKIDIIDTPLHWHKFLALLHGLHDTMLTEVMGYRCYKGKDKDYKKLMLAWELPEGKKEKAAADAWAAMFG